MSIRILRAAVLVGASVTLAATAAGAAEIETVIVTGSYVTGASERAALPVSVLSSEDIAKRGSPTMVDLIKSLPSSGAVFGDANQFTAGRTEGVSSVNLRGLSASRTLVLINGRRVTTSAASPLLPLVDLNMIPQSAIGRIEVLKDGAAATYGSEAIGGVVNIITKENFTGLQVEGDYNYLEGSTGDMNGGINLGWADDRVSIFFAGNINHQGTLHTTARDFATPKYTTAAGAINAMLYNPQGGWSGASSANYLSGFAIIRDPGDNGTDWSGMACTNRCYWRYADYDNLVEKTDRFQGYGEVNVSFAHDIKLHVEGMYGQTNVHNVPGSVSYLANQFPGPYPIPAPAGLTPGTGPNSGAGGSKLVGGVPLAQQAVAVAGFFKQNFFIPSINPGFAALPASAFKTTGTAAGGVFAGALVWRPLTTGGNALFGGRGALDQRVQDTYRLSASLSGPLSWLGDTQWNAAFTASQATATQDTPDFLVVRTQFALEGLGSKIGEPACNPNILGNQGNAAAHCYWLNPFSSGVAKNAITGAVNPGFASATANDPMLLAWLYGNTPNARDSQLTRQSNQQYVADLVLNGTLPFKFWGDNLSWAFGGQYRKDTYDFTANSFSDLTTFPCIDTPLNGDMTCAGRDGPYNFYGNYAPTHLSGGTKAIFAELDVPFTPDIQMQLAAREEWIYGGLSTFNPKGSIRWQIIDGLALRASAGTTFRAPTLGNLSPNCVNLLAIAPLVSAYIPFPTCGNGGKPAGVVGLSPEKAKSVNIGIIFDLLGFDGTIDYWHFDFANPLGAESGNAILSAMFPTVGPNHCGQLAYTGLQSRITFNNGSCAATVGGVNNIGGVRVNYTNNGPQQTHGIDLAVQYPIDDVYDTGDNLTFRLDGTYVINYRVSAQFIEGINVFPGYDAAGGLNIGLLGPTSLPRTKGSFSANYSDGGSNLNLRMNLIGGMQDIKNPTRTSIFTTPQNFLNIPLGAVASIQPRGATVAPWVTFDLAYQYAWTEQHLLFSLTMDNILGRDPPFARTDYSYDAFTANPYGRVIKFGITADL